MGSGEDNIQPKRNNKDLVTGIMIYYVQYSQVHQNKKRNTTRYVPSSFTLVHHGDIINIILPWCTTVLKHLTSSSHRIKMVYQYTQTIQDERVH